jgi:hypothetical protein
MGPAILFIAAATTVLGLRAFASSWGEVGAVAAVVALVHLMAATVAASFPDGSFDGLALHQEAVLRLAAGWNPLYGDAGVYGDNGLYLNSYPKASWISGAAVLLSTGQVEAGKLFNLTVAFAAAAFVTSVLLRLTSLGPVVAAGLGMVVALNPVVIYQSTTFYVDGALASLLAILVAGLTLAAVTRQWRPLGVALLSTALAVNLKFTGLIYSSVLLLVFIPVAWWLHGNRFAWRTTTAMATAGIVSVVLVGYSPYVRNLREHGDLFHPVRSTPEMIGLGRDGGLRPVNLNERNRVERFLLSNLSYSQEVRAPKSTTLKIPFRISRGELWGGYAADIESGGFGPLYGALLLMAGLGGLLLTTSGASPVRHSALAVSVIGLSLAAGIFVHSETWWARYVPQAWLLPLLVAVPSMALPRRSLQRSLGCALIGLAYVNLAIVAGNVVPAQFQYARATRISLREMSAASQPVSVYLGFRSLRQRLREGGVEFRMVDTPEQAGRVRHVVPTPGGKRAFWFE